MAAQCGGCGTALASDTRFCPECGQASPASASQAVAVGELPGAGSGAPGSGASGTGALGSGSLGGAPPADPGVGVPMRRFCPSCGRGLVATAAVCTGCGTAVGSPRSKGIAVILAVFLSFWSWLYTYELNKAKFWWGLGLSIVGGILTIVVVGFFVLFGVWLWAVVDNATKPDPYFATYPNALT